MEPKGKAGRDEMIRRVATLAVLAVVAAGLAAALAPGGGSGASGAPSVPHFKHVFIVVLENENAADTFGRDSKAPYLAKRLPSKGVFLRNYYGTGHLSLDNYISMVSGQAPNPQTQADCQFFTEFAPGSPASDGGPDGRQPARGLRVHVEGLHGGHERRRPAGQAGPLPASRDRLPGRHAER
jgi:phosphatidylinositol-3-phosphatase